MSRRPIMLGPVLASLLAMAMAACQTGGQRGPHAGQVVAGDGESAARAASQIYGDWKLERLRGVALADPASAHPPTLSAFDEGRAGGFAGVNRWAAPLDAEGLLSGKFTLGPAATTMMAGTPEAMELERRFLDALQATRRFDPAALADGFLTLEDAHGAELLRFVRGS